MAVRGKGQQDLRLALAVIGPAYVSQETDGWTLVVPMADEEDDRGRVAPVISSTIGRKGLVVTCWRRGAASGFAAYRKGEVDVSWCWSSPWVTVTPDEVDIEAGVAAFLEACAGQPVDGLTVRLLLRRQAPGPLEELVRLLEIPDQMLALLEPDVERDRLEHGLELVEKQSVLRTILVGPPSPSGAAGAWHGRGTAALYAVAATIAALVVGTIAIATVFDHNDWQDYLFWVLSPVLLVAAVRRWHGLWQRRAD